MTLDEIRAYHGSIGTTPVDDLLHRLSLLPTEISRERSLATHLDAAVAAIQDPRHIHDEDASAAIAHLRGLAYRADQRCHALEDLAVGIAMEIAMRLQEHP